MDQLEEKIVVAHCPECDKLVDFTYTRLEKSEDSLVYWEYSCNTCSLTKYEFSEIGFNNI